MVTNDTPDNGPRDQHHNFSFTFCPHGNCTTTCAVYPSPPLTDSQPNVPLPGHFGGVLDSPVVLLKATSPTPLSPPLTIAILTLALPDSTPGHAQSLLSPISLHWPSKRAAEDEILQDSVLMSPPFAVLFAEPCIRPPADILMYDDPNLPTLSSFSPLSEDDSCPDLLPSSPASSGATSSVDSSPPSPLFSEALSPLDSSSPSFLKLEESDSQVDGLGLSLSWLHSSPTLLSFPSLPSPELDDLNLDMDLGPGLGMSVSPSRRSVTSLPLFDESDYAYELESPQHALTISPPESPAPSLMPNALCLGLDVSVDHIPNKRPSILDAFTSAELRARLPPYLPQEELDGLLSVRARAHATLAECVAAPPASCAPTILDHELRRNVPRDAGEPRRRRKRAKELGLEADALIGFALGILPDSSTDKQRSGDDIRQGVRREKAGLVELANLSELVARMILRRRERCGVRGLEGSALQTRCWTGSPLWQSDGEHMLEAKEQVRRSVRRRGL